MQVDVTSFWEWQQHFSDEKRCLQALTKLRWPEGFQCESCGHRGKAGCCKPVPCMNAPVATSKLR